MLRAYFDNSFDFGYMVVNLYFISLYHHDLLYHCCYSYNEHTYMMLFITINVGNKEEEHRIPIVFHPSHGTNCEDFTQVKLNFNHQSLVFSILAQNIKDCLLYVISK